MDSLNDTLKLSAAAVADNFKAVPLNSANVTLAYQSGFNVASIEVFLTEFNEKLTVLDSLLTLTSFILSIVALTLAIIDFRRK